jgi:hypothetical protein
VPDVGSADWILWILLISHLLISSYLWAGRDVADPTKTLAWARRWPSQHLVVQFAMPLVASWMGDGCVPGGGGQW